MNARTLNQALVDLAARADNMTEDELLVMLADPHWLVGNVYRPGVQVTDYAERFADVVSTWANVRTLDVADYRNLLAACPHEPWRAERRLARLCGPTRAAAARAAHEAGTVDPDA